MNDNATTSAETSYSAYDFTASFPPSLLYDRPTICSDSAIYSGQLHQVASTSSVWQNPSAYGIQYRSDFSLKHCLQWLIGQAFIEPGTKLSGLVRPVMWSREMGELKTLLQGEHKIEISISAPTGHNMRSMYISYSGISAGWLYNAPIEARHALLWPKQDAPLIQSVLQRMLDHTGEVGGFQNVVVPLNDIKPRQGGVLPIHPKMMVSQIVATENASEKGQEEMILTFVISVPPKTETTEA